MSKFINLCDGGTETKYSAELLNFKAKSNGHEAYRGTDQS